MAHQLFKNILPVILLAISFQGFTQQAPAKNWDIEKIKGVRHLPYISYMGFPFLNETWVPGKVWFTNGETADSLYIKYSSFKDELLYYNEVVSAHIVIDKASLKGFSFEGNDGNPRIFRKQFYDGFFKGDRFFEVLSEGETELLAFRKVSIITTPPYKDDRGIVKNNEYSNDYQYYFYSPDKGYSPVRMNITSLLSKFDKTDQKPIKKLLRKSRIRITGEPTFVLAWTVIEREGYKINF